MSDSTEQAPIDTPPPVEPAENAQPVAENSEGQKSESAAKERTPEEIERIRLNRKIERLIQQRGELRARLDSVSQQRGDFNKDESRATNTTSHGDNEALQLTRADLQRLVEQEARKLAPSIRQQEAEIERRSAVVKKLATEWGQEKFDTFAADLDDAFGGLTDGDRPRPAVDAIFEADDPRALIEYLADPTHADEAEALSRMSAIAAARAITKLEARLASEKAKDKPQPSKAGAPIEPLKGQGSPGRKSLFDLSYAEFVQRRREQVASRR